MTTRSRIRKLFARSWFLAYQERTPRRARQRSPLSVEAREERVVLTSPPLVQPAPVSQEVFSDLRPLASAATSATPPCCRPPGGSAAVAVCRPRSRPHLGLRKNPAAALSLGAGAAGVRAGEATRSSGTGRAPRASGYLVEAYLE
jgi:hypothetical protein